MTSDCELTANGFYYTSPGPVAQSSGIVMERLRLRRLEIELGEPPDNYLGRRDKWLQEQMEYTLMQANAMSALIEARRAKR